MTNATETREELIERIVQAEAKKRPFVNVQQFNDLMGTDGKFHGPNGFPMGVEFTGETKPYWVFTQNGNSFGKRYASMPEVLEALAIRNNVKSASFARDLMDMTDERLQEQAAYWLKA
jgi:hypothetical protein